ncbi:MAG TPA: tryptophan halogenase family protein [Steroidobacteraceae bacterium]|jgi:tryptophan halogenase|nr:tryptophan halogenase family protein [Steroidobacteraceae bacterium]
MNDRRIRSVAIVGGGTAGWMAAAALSKSLAGMGIDLRLIESARVDPIGVGEATIPPIMDFIRQLGIDESDLVREIKATYKLGIGYRDWTRAGHFYFHPFGPAGPGIGNVPFQAYWLKMFLEAKAERLEEYSIQTVAALRGRFARPVHAPNTPLNKLTYALHFDAGRFASYLRGFAEAQGVLRTEGHVRSVSLRGSDGFVDSVTLESGESVSADLFIDCSGFQGLLIEGTLHAGYEDWGRWLPCDRAVIVHSERAAAPNPYTLVTARDAGWQWQIPLQHRDGNGYIYSGEFSADDAAAALLLRNLSGRALSEPAALRFRPGRRKAAWSRNVVALGLAAGFLEPLEATSIHLIQRGIAMLLKFFPDRDFAPADTDRYNRMLQAEFARVRDFLLLHYSNTERAAPFWQHCRAIPPSDSLREKIELFRSHGRILREETELFPVLSWLSVMVGQNIIPRRYDPLVDGLDARKVLTRLEELRSAVKDCVETMPSHWDFISSIPPAGPSRRPAAPG